MMLAGNHELAAASAILENRETRLIVPVCFIVERSNTLSPPLLVGRHSLASTFSANGIVVAVTAKNDIESISRF